MWMENIEIIELMPPSLICGAVVACFGFELSWEGDYYCLNYENVFAFGLDII